MTNGNGDIELRLALALRGGVSLAVWIGGACAEIDALRRSSLPRRPQEPAASGLDFWSRLLDRSAYDSVSVDVLAGASAGGLNGVLYAASQIYDFPFSAMRQLWLDVGGTEGLVQRTEEAPSLLMGDAYFGKELFVNLQRLGRSGSGRAPDGLAIDLSLSATLVTPVERRVPGPADEPLVERRYASGLRFSHPAMGWTASRRDFPSPDDGDGGGEYEIAMRRLALAGRATASYPGAFEGAIMRSSRGARFDAAASRPNANEPVDMAGRILDRGAPSDLSSSNLGGPLPSAPGPTFVISDGGVLDNIPIARALHAIAEAPAETRTERILVYLHPGAATPPTPEPTDPKVSTTDAFSVLRAAAAARITGESINADIDEIESYNDSISRAVAIRAGAFHAIRAAPDLIVAAQAALDSYFQVRAIDEGRRVFRLLSDPVRVLGGDPFPASLGPTVVPDGAWRSPMAAWTDLDRSRFDTELIAAHAGATGSNLSDVFGSGVRPLERVVRLLIEWVRFRETQLDGANLASASAAKTSLYGILAFLELAVDRPIDLAWVAAVAQRAGRVVFGLTAKSSLEGERGDPGPV